MLFWLFVIAMMIGVGLIIIGTIDWYQKHDKNRDSELLSFLYFNDGDIKDAGILITVISGTVAMIMAIILCCIYVNVDARVETNKERYTALEYKVESGACRDELGLLSKEVIDEIQEWNEDVVYYQNTQNNFWIGIFYPDVYDQFETIDYEKWK